ncbi:hypothetical protein BurJ1DRAFT_0303 [Burkholderiales bacterium JOSHI_001]|nr:hypothetical protein BurJ1DRAFT_0303 [Burkholderiales bacterium JOSHI_001]
MNCALDHLVVLAASLDEGAAWCEATLGVPPGPGGKHPLMGTHNRLLRIDGEGFPQAYLEIIAIDPAAPAPGRARWFNMDDAALQAALKREGPRLHHAVLRSPNLEMMRWGLINRGLNPGAMLAAERDTPNGTLSWRIVVRDDGRIEADGALPTLIAWNGLHPSTNMAASALQLTALRVRELPAAARDVLRWRGPEFVPAPAPLLEAVFHTPRGELTLRTPD